jgi:plastocyanin
MTLVSPSSRVTLCALGAVFALTSCGDGGSGANGDSSGEMIQVSAQDNEFSPMEVEVSAGEVTVRFTNEGTNSHTFTIEALGVDTDTVEPGESKTVTFDAPSDRTEFICKIHYESADMEGHLAPA